MPALPWPYSRDPKSPNRPPYLPQPPVLVRRVPTQLGPRPEFSRATMATYPFDQRGNPYRVIPRTGPSFMDAFNIYNGMPTVGEQRRPGVPDARSWPARVRR